MSCELRSDELGAGAPVLPAQVPGAMLLLEQHPVPLGGVVAPRRATGRAVPLDGGSVEDHLTQHRRRDVDRLGRLGQSHATGEGGEDPLEEVPEEREEETDDRVEILHDGSVLLLIIIHHYRLYVKVNSIY